MYAGVHHPATHSPGELCSPAEQEISAEDRQLDRRNGEAAKIVTWELKHLQIVVYADNIVQSMYIYLGNMSIYQRNQ